MQAIIFNIYPSDNIGEKLIYNVFHFVISILLIKHLMLSPDKRLVSMNTHEGCQPRLDQMLKSIEVPSPSAS